MKRTGRPRGIVFVALATVASLTVVPVPALGDDPECTIVGTEGDDVLVGTSGIDVICGLGGNDNISGGSNDDVIYGGAGDDVINGGSGDDIVYGEDGADLINGGSGGDVIEGGSGDDELTGGSSNDDLRGGAGVDSAAGGSGTDVCAAESMSSCETVVPDETAPASIELTRPGDGEVVFSSMAVDVAVSPVEAVGTVDLLVDDQLVATAPIQGGSADLQWDTTTVPDGDHVVRVDARDGGGEFTSSDSASVTVANDLSGSSRILADGEQGMLSVDDYVEYGLWSITNPVLLPDRYQQPSQVELEDATGLGMWFMAPWEGLSPETQSRITDYLTVTEYQVPPEEATGRSPVVLASIASPARGLLFQTDPPGSSECGGVTTQPVWVVVSKAFRCRHDVVVDGETLFRIYYTVEGLDDPGLLDRLRALLAPSLAVLWAETVSSASAGGDPDVPDAIEDIAASLVQSWDAYLALEYDEPGTPIEVVVHDPNGSGAGSPGVVLPPLLPGGSTLVQVSNSSFFHYLPRHELFHLFQYQYVGLLDFGVNRLLSICSLEPSTIEFGFPLNVSCDPASRRLAELNWFQELTAEWGAHQVQEASAGLPEAAEYADNLAEYLGRPQQQLTAWNGFSGSVQYGAFVLAEYLEELFVGGGEPDSSVIREVWEGIDFIGGQPLDALGLELSSRGTTWESFLLGFATANYLVAPSTGPYQDDDAGPLWRDVLDGDSRTVGESESLAGQVGLDLARPGRDYREIMAMQPESGTLVVEPGGTAFVDLVPPSGVEGAVAVHVTTAPASEPAARLLPFGAYPALCMDPIDIELENGNGSSESPIGDGCRFGTLAVTNPNPEGPRMTVEWEAVLSSTEVCVDTIVPDPSVHTVADHLAAVGGDAGPDGNQFAAGPAVGGLENITSLFFKDDDSTVTEVASDTVKENMLWVQRDSGTRQWRTGSAYPTITLTAPPPTPIGNSSDVSWGIIPITAWDCANPEIRHTAAVSEGTVVDVSVDVNHTGGGINTFTQSRVDFYTATNEIIPGPGALGWWAVDTQSGSGTLNASVEAPANARWMRMEVRAGISEDAGEGTTTTVTTSNWTISTTRDALNFDFETGDLTGWSVVGEGDTWHEIQSPGLFGTDHAFRIETAENPILGIEQTVTASLGECEIGVFATGEAGTTIRLEVVDATDDSPAGSADYTFTGGETDVVELDVDEPGFLPEVYTVRLLYVGRSFELAVVTFDQVFVSTCE